MPRVLIGAAHTLENPGEIFGDLREADLTRKILKKVVPELEKLNIEFQAVPLDLPLLDRIEWINPTGYTEAQGDIFIEIHVNDGGKRGIESWHKGNASPTNKSQELAKKINESVCKETGYTNQGDKSEHDHELGSLLILNQIKVIGTTVEFLYIDNEEDIKILKDESKLDELSKAIANAIKNYVDTFPKTETKEAESTLQASEELMEEDEDDEINPFGSPFPKLPAKSPTLIMDREERKKMIIEVYKQVMGEEPKTTALNTYLNQGLSKENLYAKLCESKEHTKLVEDAKKFKEMEKELESLKTQLLKSEAKSNDMSKMVENFNKLLHHKNTYIGQLQQELVQNEVILNGEYFTPKEQKTLLAESERSRIQKEKRSLSNIIMKILGI